MPKRLSNNFRLEKIEKFKVKNSKVVEILVKLTARKVDLIQPNTKTTKKYFKQTIKPRENNLMELHNPLVTFLRVLIKIDDCFN